MDIQNEAYKRYPILNVWEGTGISGQIVDVNEKQRSVFISGAEYASNKDKDPNSINICINGVPLQLQANIRERLINLLRTELNLIYQNSQI